MQLNFQQIREIAKNNKRVLTYVADPNAEKVVPFDPTGPCVAFPITGPGNMLTWDPDAKLWR